MWQWVKRQQNDWKKNRRGRMLKLVMVTQRGLNSKPVVAVYCKLKWIKIVEIKTHGKHCHLWNKWKSATLRPRGNKLRSKNIIALISTHPSRLAHVWIKTQDSWAGHIYCSIPAWSGIPWQNCSSCYESSGRRAQTVHCCCNFSQ